MDINKKNYLILNGVKLPENKCKYKDCNYCENLQNCKIWNNKK
jgi:hypothetical protein